jgi:hypothetical protein
MEDYTSMQVSYGSPEEPWNVLAAYGGDCYSGKVCNPTGQARQLASDEVRWLQWFAFYGCSSVAEGRHAGDRNMLRGIRRAA